MPSKINRPNVQKAFQGPQALSGKEYSKFFYDYDQLPKVRVGEDDIDTETSIVYNATGKPATITVKEINPDPAIAQNLAKRYSFEYNDGAFPNKPTKITVETIEV